MPIKQEVLDPEELLREAEEQAGDDGGEQVEHALALQCPLTLPKTHCHLPVSARLHYQSANPVQVLLDARGLKRLILSFERKVRLALSRMGCFSRAPRLYASCPDMTTLLPWYATQGTGSRGSEYLLCGAVVSQGCH